MTARASNGRPECEDRKLALKTFVNQKLIFRLFDTGEEVQSSTLTGVLGGSVSLPCPLYNMGHGNSSAAADVSLILWYRHGSGGVPIYAVDARQSTLGEAQHQNYLEQEAIDAPPANARSEILFRQVRGRFVFDLMDRPPRLWIRRLSSQDQGEYRCRVDYRGDRTQNYLVQLQVVGE